MDAPSSFTPTPGPAPVPGPRQPDLPDPPHQPRDDRPPDQPPLANRNFRVFLVGEGISALGDAITFTALPLLVLALTGSGLAMGILGALQMLPDLFIGMLAGVVADRADRRRMPVPRQGGPVFPLPEHADADPGPGVARAGVGTRRPRGSLRGAGRRPPRLALDSLIALEEGRAGRFESMARIRSQRTCS
jgi:hypothetical protein